MYKVEKFTANVGANIPDLIRWVKPNCYIAWGKANP